MLWQEKEAAERSLTATQLQRRVRGRQARESTSVLRQAREAEDTRRAVAAKREAAIR